MNVKTLLPAIAATTLLATACGEYIRNSSQIEKTTATKKAALTGVADFSGMQVTGVTVTDSGRIFANFPRWRDGVGISVVEIKANGSWSAYPDLAWNSWSGIPRENAFTSVQAVLAHRDSLFVLDPSSPVLRGVVGNAMLYEFDLKLNVLKSVWKFDEQVAPARSYLSALRIDEARSSIYITDSGLGAILVLDLKSGTARRVLDGSPSTKSAALTFFKDGSPLLKTTGRPFRRHSNGIALYNGYLYYHCLTGRHLYRISTDALTNANLPPDSVATYVEDLGSISHTGGMEFDKAGNLYMADLEKKAIVYRTPAGEMRTLVRDPELTWIDTLALSPMGELMFTDSRSDQAPPGAPVAGRTFSIYKVALPK